MRSSPRTPNRGASRSSNRRARAATIECGGGRNETSARPRGGRGNPGSGRARTSGPVYIPLGKTYKAKGCTTAAKKLVEAVESSPNAFHVNVHNVKYPNGAVRGQLVVGMAHM